MEPPDPSGGGGIHALTPPGAARDLPRGKWLQETMAKRTTATQRAYRPQQGWRLDPVAAGAPKALASQYYQLKFGHAVIGP